MLNLQQSQQQQQQQPRSFLATSSSNGGLTTVAASNGLVPTSTQPSLNNNVFENGLLSKRFNSASSAAAAAQASSALGHLGNLGDLSTGLNPYEKWSNGSDKLFDQHTSESILELSSKLLNLGMYFRFTMPFMDVP